MRTDKIRKYLIPNIPYLFILWAFLKLGTAYRLAAGNDFAHKLIGLGQTIGPAFADFAPGLAPLDWLVGIVGAVGFRLLIYFKSKNAKKFRRDAEYGSARWGTEKDIKPFVDPRFENNVILTGTEFLTMNTRPKIPANARNLNCCIIGSSGSGKTRFWLTPQLLQAHSSYVVVDPKGGVLGQVGAFLQKRGYKIKVFNSIDFSKSMHYNPLAYIRNEADILKFVDALISNTKGEGKEGDPFWTKSETLLYCALIAYIIFEGPAEDRNMNTLVDMISGMEVKEDDEDFMNAVDYMFAGLEKRKPDCFAVKQYKKYKLASGKTAKSILISCGARLAPFDIPQLREVMAYDELELDRSAFVIADGKPQIMKDLAYNGSVMLPALGVKLHVKGINRERIAEDVVIYTHYFGPSTRTNSFGCEVRIKDGKVAEISKAGNLRIDKNSVIVSAHGTNAKILEQLQIGDRASVQQTLGDTVADKAEVVLGAGPMLVEDGKRNVRSVSEQIAGDIAYGRAPRTAIGVKKDGTVVILVADGRRTNSVGMTLDEVARYMIKLGAVSALNFDGGGSSEMVLNNKILNNPSDGNERAVSVGLGLFSKKN